MPTKAGTLGLAMGASDFGDSERRSEDFLRLTDGRGSDLHPNRRAKLLYRAAGEASALWDKAAVSTFGMTGYHSPCRRLIEELPLYETGYPRIKTFV
ncbi:hypothetical protein QWZ10_19130 [Paracoccus cavernae]|uniref:Uncharacterized protein n=1 Tax=Paracoccus cavernae TaxID=1571207 RepID=A0ABT8DD05_9RHOB|nr:hypothetical protein [Paracoccus cavernae]